MSIEVVLFILLSQFDDYCRLPLLATIYLMHSISLSFIHCLIQSPDK
jgi:hypothetical protein